MKFKALAIIVVSAMALTGCKKVAPGGNTSILKRDETVPHYSDDARTKYEGEVKKEDTKPTTELVGTGTQVTTPTQPAPTSGTASTVTSTPEVKPANKTTPATTAGTSTSPTHE